MAYNRRNWTVHNNNAGGWFAWNCVERKRVDLVLVGSFRKAITEFEKTIGEYYV